MDEPRIHNRLRVLRAERELSRQMASKVAGTALGK